MRLRALRACAGLSVERLSFSGIGFPRSVIDLNEVADLSQHTGELWALLLLGGAPDLAQAECAERAAVALRLPDRATNLLDLDLRHSHSPAIPQPPRRRAR